MNPPPELFETARLILRRPVETDALAIFNNYASDPMVTRFLSWKTHTTIEDTLAFLRYTGHAWESGKGYPLAMELKGVPGVIGMIEPKPEGHMVVLGYGMGKAWWGQGLMTEAVKAVIEWAFSQPGVIRVWAFCDVENTGSYRVMEKAGMQREGRLRKWGRPANEFPFPRDCFIYSIIKE